MQDARAAALRELEEMLSQVRPITPTAFAKMAGVASSTVTRFLNGQSDNVPSTRTLAKLRNARDQILLQRATLPGLDQLTKDVNKRTLIARLLTADSDMIAKISDILDGVPEAPSSNRKRQDIG